MRHSFAIFVLFSAVVPVCCLEDSEMIVAIDGPSTLSLATMGIDMGDFDHLRSSLHSIMNIQPVLFNDESIATKEELKSYGMHTDLLATTASCVNFTNVLLTPSAYYLSTCGNTVNYQFYLPANTALSFLEKTARSVLNNTALSFLPNQCQISLKKLVCSNVYLKCYPGASPTDTATKTGWNTHIYSDVNLGNAVKLPFERPCKNLCVNANVNCLGVLGLLGLTQSCTATYDYSKGIVTAATPKQYDASNDTNYCNDVPKPITVGSSKEKYIGSVCDGIVDTLYVVPSGKVSKSLAPMQKPYVVQTQIETALATQLANSSVC